MRLIHHAAIILLLLAIGGCERSSVNRYASRDQADAAGAIDRGWVPDFIPANASDIVEVHSVDSNQVRIEFTAPENEYNELVAHAELVSLPKSFERAIAKKIGIPSWSSLGRNNLQPIARCKGNEGEGLGLRNSETGRIHYFEPVHLPGACSRGRNL